MGVVGHVVDPGAIPSGPNQPRQPQLGQVLRDPGRMGPHQRSQLIDRVLAVEQGPDDAQTGLVTEELEHSHGGLELTVRGNHIYLRIHADRHTKGGRDCERHPGGAWRFDRLGGAVRSGLWGVAPDSELADKSGLAACHRAAYRLRHGAS